MLDFLQRYMSRYLFLGEGVLKILSDMLLRENEKHQNLLHNVCGSAHEICDDYQSRNVCI